MVNHGKPLRYVDELIFPLRWKSSLTFIQNHLPAYGCIFKCSDGLLTAVQEANAMLKHPLLLVRKHIRYALDLYGCNRSSQHYVTLAIPQTNLKMSIPFVSPVSVWIDNESFTHRHRIRRIRLPCRHIAILIIQVCRYKLFPV